MRLLDEIGNLASGDLTVRAKVTEHMTGAIADSINYTIDELRRLVAGINAAAQQVTVRDAGGAERLRRSSCRPRRSRRPRSRAPASR